VTAGFLGLATLLTLGAAVFLLLPLVRRREDAKPARATALVAVLLLMGGAVSLYLIFSEYSWTDTRAVADTPAAQAAVLARKLAKQPEDLQGWLELGGKYMELEQFPLAARAYQRADALANGRNAAAVIGLAEALLAIDIEEIRGRAGRLFDRALEIEPQNFKALFYSAIAAFSRDDVATGRERFQTLLALNPPENIRGIIEKQLQSLDAARAPGTGKTESAAAGAQVQVRVTVSPELRFRQSGQAALFVLARDPNQPGPPFAAKRLPLEFPVDVTLSAADAMLPQRRISAGQTLEVVARISLDGQPQSASGDPFGQVSYHVGKDGKLNLVIDRLAP
jgi:cytochrome c-type biogenesis protein CcmH